MRVISPLKQQSPWPSGKASAYGVEDRGFDPLWRLFFYQKNTCLIYKLSFLQFIQPYQL